MAGGIVERGGGGGGVKVGHCTSGIGCMMDGSANAVLTGRRRRELTDTCTAIADRSNNFALPRYDTQLIEVWL